MNACDGPAAVPQRVVDLLAGCDTATVSDALDSLEIASALIGVRARVPGARACGRVFTVTYRAVAAGGPKFRNAANYLDDVPNGSIVVIDNGGSTLCTNWGSLLTSVAQSRGVRGTVVHGCARDVARIRTMGYPLFSTGVTMTSGKNRVELDAVGKDVDVHGVLIRAGDLLLADDDGALVVPAAVAPEVARRAMRVAVTERRIADFVRGGNRLDDARRLYNYAEPWNPSAEDEGSDA